MPTALRLLMCTLATGGLAVGVHGLQSPPATASRSSQPQSENAVPAALLAQAQPAPLRTPAGVKPAAPKPDLERQQPQPAPPEVPQQDFAPKDWVAFVSVSEMSLPRALHVVERAPYFLVLRDGRAIWRDDSRPMDASKRDPDEWRTGKIDPAKLAALKDVAGRNRFLTVRPVLDPTRPPVIITTGATPQLGVAISPNQARIAPLLPAAQAGEAYHSALSQVRDAILALKPVESTRYEPETIRVEILDGPVRGGQAAVRWPFSSVPPTFPGQYLYYSGENARAVVRALSTSTTVRLSDRVALVQWAPAIDVPIRLPVK